MLRRRHKKSRGGCVECKRRHVKCDEGRPECALCHMSERKCTYLSPPDEARKTASQTVSRAPSPSALAVNPSQSASPASSFFSGAGDSISLDDGSMLGATSESSADILMNVRPLLAAAQASVHTSGALHTASYTNHVPMLSGSIPPSPSMAAIYSVDPVIDEPVNLGHMEIITHLLANRGILNLTSEPRALHDFISISLQAAVRAPYLMYELLAFATRHLATLQPSGSPAAARRLHQSVVLQTRAVSIFNAAWATPGGSPGTLVSPSLIDRHNCVTLTLFAGLLGNHVLVDALAWRDAHNLDDFLGHYMPCVQLQRGVNSVAEIALPLLRESDMAPMLEWGRQYHRIKPRGDDCQHLRELLVSGSSPGKEMPGPVLHHDEIKACNGSLDLLQVGFDAFQGAGRTGGDGDDRNSNSNNETKGANTSAPENGTAGAPGSIDSSLSQMMLMWSLLMPMPYKTMLMEKRPAALAVLAYYAMLLHRGRHLWQIGDAGSYILRLVVNDLSPEWHSWLARPCAEVFQDQQPYIA